MRPQNISLGVPEEITLYFCGNAGCVRQLEFKANPIGAALGLPTPVWQCPIHGLAVGAMRSVTYVPKA